MAPVEMIMTPHPEPKISNNEILRERSREMQNPCCNIVANTSCDEKALETSTKKSLFDSQDQEEQQSIHTPGSQGSRMSREEWWTKFAVSSVLGLVIGVVLGLKSVSQRACQET
jgi:ElaB/YqjD/DUF883 family membrane-anchored ribosome-binding protein